MAKSKKYHLDFEIDKLTNSIENTFTGDSFQTDIIRLSKSDLKLISVAKGWIFDWKHEHQQNDRDVYKLTIQNNPAIIQGLISFTVRADHVYMHLLESAPFNLGKKKFTMVFPEIWLPMLAKFLSNMATMVLCRLLLKHNLLVIMKKH